MLKFLKNHKIETAYVIGLAIVVLLSNTVFASTDVSEEPVIIVETETEEISDDTPQNEDVELSETPLPTPVVENEESEIQNENVESETTGKEDNTNTSNMVVDFSEVMTFLQVTNTCLIVLIFGSGSVLGVLLCKCLFGWLM